ncbi:hypothetical protein E2C01_037656 [Portunus trituberculatus]|uniref:Uncharacterized protein n=1 Tax=Portunus trituberculatus TaxID=210409 RepID=A0A5B7FEP1_PORTR|nr:hypothetical protein [Portunus trituberculatus]
MDSNNYWVYRLFYCSRPRLNPATLNLLPSSSPWTVPELLLGRGEECKIPEEERGREPGAVAASSSTPTPPLHHQKAQAIKG